jgi:hypothetical protein
LCVAQTSGGKKAIPSICSSRLTTPGLQPGKKQKTKADAKAPLLSLEEVYHTALPHVKRTFPDFHQEDFSCTFQANRKQTGEPRNGIRKEERPAIFTLLFFGSVSACKPCPFVLCFDYGRYATGEAEERGSGDEHFHYRELGEREIQYLPDLKGKRL